MRLQSFGGQMAAIAAGLLMAFAAQAQTLSISGTKHNLGTGNTILNANKMGGAGATAEICVFCHTPHGASDKIEAPLWNRAASTGTYTTYDSLGTVSLDGATAPVGSVSIACLSCHDGVQAMSAVINTPGSGTTGLLAGTWSGNNVTTDGKLSATAVSNLGQDLSNDHPIGIQYAGGGFTAASATGNKKDPDFKDPSNKELNGSRVFWVDTSVGSPNVREKTDMMLYNRTLAAASGGAGSAEPFVECASCHDPHMADNATFLRISNAGSAVCLACHTK